MKSGRTKNKTYIAMHRMVKGVAGWTGTLEFGKEKNKLKKSEKRDLKGEKN